MPASAASRTPAGLTPLRRRVQHHLARYQLLWLAGLCIALSGTLLALALQALRSEAIESGRQTLDAFSRVIDEMTSRTLQTTQVHLELAASEIARLAPGASEPVIETLLDKHLQRMPYAITMWVMDASGKVLAGTADNSAGIDGSGRDFFQALRTEPARTPVIGRPAVGPAIKRWRIPVAHSIRDSQGRFQGAVVVGVDPAYFAAAWASVDLGPDYAVALFRRDQTLMLRSPADPAQLGQRFPEMAIFTPPLQGLQHGRFEKQSAMDDVPRYFTFRALQAWPDLVLVVGQARGVILAPWWRMAGVAALVWAIAGTAVAALSVVLHRARERHAAVAERARALGARLDLATSATSIGVWEWDLANDQAVGSPSYYTMLGYPAQDGPVDRQSWFDRCHPEDIARAREKIAEALSGATERYDYEIRLRHADGEYRWVRLLGRVTEHNAQGAPRRMVGVRMDIHQNVLAEEALRKSEALNLAVLNSVQAQIAVLDREGAVVALNASWRQYSLVDRYLAGKGMRPITSGDNYVDVCRHLPPRPAGSGAGTPVAEGIQSVLDRRNPEFNLTYTSHTPQEERWFSMQVTPLASTNGGAVIAHSDITDRVEATTNLRQLMRLNTLRTRINRAIIGQHARAGLLQEICQVAVGHEPFVLAWIGQADPSTGRVALRALAGPERSFLAPLFDPADGLLDAASVPLPHSAAEVLTITHIANQATEWPGWAAQALASGFQSAAVVGFACDGPHDASLHLIAREPAFFTPAGCQVLRDIGNDITLAVAALASEAAREKAELALHALLRDKEALLKEVHHRVKNNLQVVSSLLRLEAARDVGPSTVSVLRDMQGRIQAMALLHESLYGSGNFAAVDLAAYLRQLATQAFATFSTRAGAVQLQLDLASVDVSMDQAITCGLLVNELLSNSLKHGFPGGQSGEIQLTLRAIDDRGAMQLKIADDGVGLPPDLELRQTRSLGLQLASDLAGQLGGTLRHGGGPGTWFEVDFRVDGVA